MDLPPSQPPRHLPECLRWKTVKVGSGLKGPFLLAGAPFGLETHHPGTRTQPCYAALLGCKLRCPWCAYARRFTCYVPLINFDDKKNNRIVVMGGRKTWASVEGIEVGSVVMLGKGEKARDTIVVKKVPDNTVRAIVLTRWRDGMPYDIRPYLFHLWQNRELSEAFAIDFFSSIRTDEIEKRVRSLEDDDARTDAV